MRAAFLCWGSMWRWVLAAARLLAAAGLLLAAAVAQTAPAWTRAGPAALVTSAGTPMGGPLAALVSDAQGDLYAGGLGGVWLYKNSQWTALTSSDPAPVSALAVSADDSAMYAGGGYWGGSNFASESRGGAGLLYSGDNGVSWSVRGAAALGGLVVTRLWLDPGDNQHLLAATAAAADSASGAAPGLWVSHDGGITWSELVAGTVWDVCGNGGNFLAATEAGLQYSAAGQPFQPVAGASGYGRSTLIADGTGFLALLAGGPQPALAAISSNGVVTGSTSLPAADPNFSGGARGLALAVAPGGAVYAAGSELWRRDGAGSWVPVTTGMPATQPRALLAAPDGGIWMATDNGLWQQTGGGAFVSLNGGLVNVGVSAMSLAADGSIEVALEGGGVATASNPGGAWTLAAAGGAGVPANTDPAVDASGGLEAEIAPGGVEVSVDGGNTWQAVAGLPAAPLMALTFDSQHTLWAATLGEGVWSIPMATAGGSLTLAAAAQAIVATQVEVTATAMLFGQPEAGAAVKFTAGGWSQTAVTGADGTVAVEAPVPQRAGGFVITATSGSKLAATSAVTAMAGAATQLVIASGQGQPALPPSAVLPDPLQVEAEDSFGNPVAGVTVNFAASAGSLSANAAVTDANGMAAVKLTLPAAAGVVTVTAAAAGLPVTFTATAAAPPGFTLLLSPASQGAEPNQGVSFTLSVVAAGGFSEAVNLACVQPATACAVAPSSIMPGKTAAVTVSSAAADAAAGSTLAVQVEGTAAGMPPQLANATIALEALTLTAAIANVAVTPGGAAAAVPLAISGVNGLSGPVTLSVALEDGSALPGALQATFEPSATPTLTGGAAASTLELSVAGNAGETPPGEWPPWIGFIGLGLAAVCIACDLRRRRRRLAWLLGALLLTAAACGGGSPAVPSAADPPALPQVSTYTVVVTARSQGLAATASVSVAVTGN